MYRVGVIAVDRNGADLNADRTFLLDFHQHSLGTFCIVWTQSVRQTYRQTERTRIGRSAVYLKRSRIPRGADGRKEASEINVVHCNRLCVRSIEMAC